MTTLKCPGCPGRREHGHYLCNTCWRTLPASTRGRLTLRDRRAFLRLRQLHAELAAKTPLPLIRVGR